MNKEGTQDLEGSPFPQGSLERTLWLEGDTPATKQPVEKHMKGHAGAGQRNVVPAG